MTGRERVSLQEAIEFQAHWNEADRRLARDAITWAQLIDPGIHAYIPPAREVAVVADSADRRLITFRAGNLRFHKRPPFAGL